ncbi:uncharacterized protein LOC141656321 [Silene latifolia]|uniref:uncharacterized protein LOC141656321 n=1 Tax=Silene latifolia TaxID=37657 RepID=UPI003D77FA5C
MSCIKTFLSRSYPLLKPFKNPSESLLSNPIHKSLFNFFSTQLPNSVSNPKKPKKSTKNKRALDVVFKEALGFCEKEESLENFSGENGELKKKMLDLEMEIKQLREENVGFLNEVEVEGKGKDGVVSNPKPETLLGKKGTLERFCDENVVSLKEVEVEGNGKDGVVSNPKPRTLNALFGSEVVFKKISQDMQLLLRHLYDCGYFKDVNFLPENRFDLSCFYEEYAHSYVKSALQRFGNDSKEISKCLSGSDAKSIALFGCPSLNKGDVFAAKDLRSFFKISEESVCNKCLLNDTCKYRDKRARKNDITTLRVDSLLRLLRAYSLEEVSPKLKLTDDMKACVSRLIHEVIKLSKGVDEVAADGGDQT